MPITFGERLQLLRHHRHWTQEEVSTMVGISRAAYAQYERNKYEPSFIVLIRLADLFTCTTDYLLGRE